jgi:tyrosyl-DNA phosphodiesterase 2
MENVALEARMRGIAAVVAEEQPHVVCFQEVTAGIESLLRAAPFFASYDASPAPHGAPYYTLLLLRRPHAVREPPIGRTDFRNSSQGRDLLCGVLSLGGGVTLLASTCHLESYCGPQQTSSRERVEQMGQALRSLNSMGAPNTLFAGDTNWDDALDGDLARLLPSGWADAWPTLRPGEPGYTYNSAANAMLMGNLKKRLDRVLFKLRDYEPAEVRMVGTQPIPGASYEKVFRNGGSKRLPVCNSDHFGLLFTARLRAPASGRVAA